MSLLTAVITNNALRQGVEYLIDPDNRILLIGIGIVFLFFVIKIVLKSIKRLVLLIAGIVVLYFVFQYFTNIA